MDRERWRLIEGVFDRALQQDPATRSAYLDSACGDDQDLRKEVEELLNHHAKAQGQGFLSGGPDGGHSVPTPDPEEQDRYIGTDFGPYRIVRRQGGGGMGHVYLATRHTDFRQQVAIKVLRPGMDTENILGRFRTEIQILAALSRHENIAGLLDAGTTEDGLPYFVMEFVDGERLDTYCDRHRLTLRERIELFVRICSAVQYAHQHMVIHRDLKMSNILVRADGVPKLIDFGIAKLTAPELIGQTLELTLAGQRLMTLDYASPEQVRGDPLTQATDVYSLGLVLYELIAGCRPYGSDRGADDDLLQAICDLDPPPPSALLKRNPGMPEPSARSPRAHVEDVARARRTTPKALHGLVAGDLDAIVLKALRKEPQRRYQSAEDLRDDLRCFLAGDPVEARPLAGPERVFRWSRRNPVSVALFMTVALTLIVGLWQLSRLSDQLVQSAAIEGAAFEAQTLETVQDFYSTVVVDKVKDVVPVTHRYAMIHGAIPVPASFTIDLGEHLRESQTSGMFVRLYSDYPFEHRKNGGPKDEFETTALRELRRNPDRPFYRFEPYEGRPTLRYAAARVMQATCVVCHNSHPDSTKTDWQVGDVRGVLEIIRPLDADIARASVRLRETFIYMLGVSVLLLALAVFFLFRRRLG